MSKVLDAKAITYCLRDMKDNEILSGFYDYELQKVKNNVMYQIQKILKTRTGKGERSF